MGRLKKWLVGKYLPAYTRLAMLEEVEKLRRQLNEKDRKIDRLKAYAEGLEFALMAKGHWDELCIGGVDDGADRGAAR